VHAASLIGGGDLHGVADPVSLSNCPVFLWSVSVLSLCTATAWCSCAATLCAAPPELSSSLETH